MNPNELAYAIGEALGNAVVLFCVVTPFILAAIAVYLIARRVKRRKGLSLSESDSED